MSSPTAMYCCSKPEEQAAEREQRRWQRAWRWCRSYETPPAATPDPGPGPDSWSEPPSGHRRLREVLMVRECLRETFTTDPRRDGMSASAPHPGTPGWAKTPRTKRGRDR